MPATVTSKVALLTLLSLTKKSSVTDPTVTLLEGNATRRKRYSVTLLEGSVTDSTELDEEERHLRYLVQGESFETRTRDLLDNKSVERSS